MERVNSHVADSGHTSLDEPNIQETKIAPSRMRAREWEQDSTGSVLERHSTANQMTDKRELGGTEAPRRLDNWRPAPSDATSAQRASGRSSGCEEAADWTAGPLATRHGGFFGISFRRPVGFLYWRYTDLTPEAIWPLFKLLFLLFFEFFLVKAALKKRKQRLEETFGLLCHSAKSWNRRRQ